jgi:tetratricopeptide (TPR) repeat protein
MARDAADGFTTREVAEALGLRVADVRAWTRGGVLAPRRDARGACRYSFQDVALLKEAWAVAADKTAARRVRSALCALRVQLPAGQPLSGVRVSLAGKRVLVRDAERIWEPESGQIFFDFWSGADPGASGSRATAEALEGAAGLEPTDPARPTLEGRTADEWYDEGCDLEAVSSLDAEAAYRQAIALDPAHADAHVNLGRLLHERGLVTEAEVHYRAAVAADPESAAARYNLGVALEDLGRAAEAIAAYRGALALDERLAPAHFNLARLCEARGEDVEALAHLAAYRRLAAASRVTSRRPRAS